MKTSIALSMLLFTTVTTSAAPVVKTFVDTPSSPPLPNEVPLGYPVPTPSNNANDPAHPYRKYKVILDVMDNLNPTVVEKKSIGKTQVRKKNIFALKLTGNKTTRDDGSPKRKILILAGVHAREWIGVEVAMRIAQKLAERYDDNASARNIETWLLNNTEIWIVPVVNVDGFLMTQDNPAQFVTGGNTSQEGRLRRKNLRDADEVFDTATNDWNKGVDLNRNWPHDRGNYANDYSDFEDYRGSADLSEAESLSINDLLKKKIKSDLVFVMDYHAFDQTVNWRETSDTERDAITEKVLQKVATACGNYPLYTLATNPSINPPIPYPAGGIIEYIGSDSKIPTASIELPPDSFLGNRGHEGFLLPENRVLDVFNENYNGFKVYAPWAAQDAYLQKLQIGSGGKKFISEWKKKSGVDSRTLSDNGKDSFIYQGAPVELVFSEPMETRVAGIAVYPSVTIRKFSSGDSRVIDAANSTPSWEAARYAGDKATFGHIRFMDFTNHAVARNFEGEAFLEVDHENLAGDSLDGNPGSMRKWSGEGGKWINYENTSHKETGASDSGRDIGGADTNQRVLVDNFRPVLDQLSVAASEGARGKLYIGDWSDSADNGGTKLIENTSAGQRDAMNPLVLSQDLFGAWDSWAIIMNFTEPMDTSTSPTVKARMSNGVVQTLSTNPITWSNDGMQAVLRTDLKPIGANAVSGTTTIQVSGVKDLAGHNLDANPATIVRRDDQGNWIGIAENPPDKNHAIRVDAVAPKVTFLGWWGSSAVGAAPDTHPAGSFILYSADPLLSSDENDSDEPKFISGLERIFLVDDSPTAGQTTFYARDRAGNVGPSVVVASAKIVHEPEIDENSERPARVGAGRWLIHINSGNKEVRFTGNYYLRYFRYNLVSYWRDSFANPIADGNDKAALFVGTVSPEDRSRKSVSGIGEFDVEIPVPQDADLVQTRVELDGQNSFGLHGYQFFQSYSFRTREYADSFEAIIDRIGDRSETYAEARVYCVEIDSGALTTAIDTITVMFSATGSPTAYRLQGDVAESSARFIGYSGEETFSVIAHLTSGDGVKTVSVSVKNRDGDISPSLSDTITRNSTPIATSAPASPPPPPPPPPTTTPTPTSGVVTFVVQPTVGVGALGTATMLQQGSSDTVVVVLGSARNDTMIVKLDFVDALKQNLIVCARVDTSMFAMSKDSTERIGNYALGSNTVREITVRDSQNRDIGPDPNTFNSVRLTWNLDPSLAASGVKTSLEVFYFDELSRKWLVVRDDSRVINSTGKDNFVNYASGDTVSILVRHFTIFGVFPTPPSGFPAQGNVGGVTVYPNPYVPYDGNLSNGEKGTATEGIRIGNLSGNDRIEIYDIRGRLVDELSVAGTGLAIWNARNRDNQEVGTGVYLIVVKGVGGIVTRKVAVVR